MHSEVDPSARASMVTAYTNLMQGITSSVDLTRSEAYDPYFMSLELLNLRAGQTAGRTAGATAETQFHTAPPMASTISSLPGNSRDLSDLLNNRAGSEAGPVPVHGGDLRGSRVSY